ncbi:MAG: lysostaphin resistance A-like protein, partial [bacterium]
DELLFQGFMLRAFSVRYGEVVAMLVTALATALFHTWEPFKFGHAFVMGIIFATAVLWSRSVVASILLHALLNSLALLPGMG